MKKICEFLNCKEEGIYPAPRSRKDITNYKKLIVTWAFKKNLRY